MEATQEEHVARVDENRLEQAAKKEQTNEEQVNEEQVKEEQVTEEQAKEEEKVNEEQAKGKEQAMEEDRANWGTMADLPLETFFGCVDLLGDDIESLLALARTCRSFHRLVTPLLYAVEARTGSPRALCWGAERGLVVTVQCALAAGVHPDSSSGGLVTAVRLHSHRRATIGTGHNGSKSKSSNSSVVPSGKPRKSSGTASTNPPASDKMSRMQIIPTNATALHFAVANGRVGVVEELIAGGASLDSGSSFLCGCSALRCFQDSHSVDGGGSYNGFNRWTPLHIAICNRRPELAKLLLSRGASSVVCSFKETVDGTQGVENCVVHAAHSAAATGQTEILQYLIDNGHFPEVDVPDQGGFTPFHYAFISGHWDTAVPWLLERGADINTRVRCPTLDMDDQIRDTFGSLLFHMCLNGSYVEAKMLIDLGADPHVAFETTSRSGLAVCWPSAALHLACGLSPVEAPRLTTELFRLVPSPDPNHRSDAQQNASEEARCELVGALLQKPPSPGSAASLTQGWESPLMAASGAHLTGVVKLLLEGGADPNYADEYGWTALMRACSAQAGSHGFGKSLCVRGNRVNIETIRLLLQHGARVNEQQCSRGRINDLPNWDGGKTALHVLLEALSSQDAGSRLETAQLLLEAGADPNKRMQDVDDFDALFGEASEHLAAWETIPRAVKNSLASMTTPIAYALARCTGFVRLLYAHGGRIDPRGLEKIFDNCSSPHSEAHCVADIFEERDASWVDVALHVDHTHVLTSKWGRLKKLLQNRAKDSGWINPMFAAAGPEIFERHGAELLWHGSEHNIPLLVRRAVEHDKAGALDMKAERLDQQGTKRLSPGQYGDNMGGELGKRKRSSQRRQSSWMAPQTVLGVAVHQTKAEETIKHLLEGGADMHYRPGGEKGRWASPLETAILEGNVDYATLMLAFKYNKPEAPLTLADDPAALHGIYLHAAVHGLRGAPRLDVIKAVLDAGVKRTEKDANGVTPLGVLLRNMLEADPERQPYWVTILPRQREGVFAHLFTTLWDDELSGDELVVQDVQKLLGYTGTDPVLQGARKALEKCARLVGGSNGKEKVELLETALVDGEVTELPAPKRSRLDDVSYQLWLDDELGASDDSINNYGMIL